MLRLVLVIVLAGLASPAAAMAARIHEPAPGAHVYQGASLRFDWVWDSDEYATSSIVFTRSADPEDPTWTWASGSANATPDRIVISDCAYGSCYPFLDSNATIAFSDARFVPGAWFWRLCNKSIYGEDDKCSYDAEVRPLTIVALPQPEPTAQPTVSPTPTPTPAPPPVSPEQDTSPVPTLTTAQAKTHLRTALREQFRGSYRHGYARRIAACSRLSRLRIRCSLSWAIGDLSYRGKGTIIRLPMRDVDGSIAWDYTWTIRKVDGYCRATGGKRCTRTYRR